MVSARSSLWQEPLPKDSNPPPMTMTDNDALRQLQACIAEMERLPLRSIDSFDTLVEHFSSQYAMIRSHRLTSIALTSLHQEDDESLQKFMDRFSRIAIQIRNLNLEVALHSMLLALRPGKFVDSLCKKPPSNMNKLHERAS
ncbi:hypothetical protein GmHk_16G046596 [Glycine max]|nr:hypothetical protein GmHk_16G046596 [Glycine max]